MVLGFETKDMEGETESEEFGTDDPRSTEGERALAAMLDINWNTNWSTLPVEAEQHVEKAYEHLTRAREIAEEEDR